MLLSRLEIHRRKKDSSSSEFKTFFNQAEYAAESIRLLQLPASADEGWSEEGRIFLEFLFSFRIS